jgi:hypothetical protein
VRSLPPRKTTRNDTTHPSPHIRNSGGNNQQKAHIKVKISKAIMYQHEASKQALAFWRTTTRQAFIKASFLQAKQLAGLHGIFV